MYYEKKKYTAPEVEGILELRHQNLLLNLSGEVQDGVDEGDSDTFGTPTYN